MLFTEAAQTFQFDQTLSAGQEYTRYSTSPEPSSSKGLRLADVAKQHGFGVHVENWREDMLPVRQYLPLQHIIGSLKRDRDETVRYMPSQFDKIDIVQRQRQLAATSARSEDPFLNELRSSKRRRTSTSSRTESVCTVKSDPDRRFTYQAAEHSAKNIDQAALPGLNHILQLATITADERDIFSEYAPQHLDDSQLLMSEVLQMRERMIRGVDDTIKEEEIDDQLRDTQHEDKDSFIPPERDAEVNKAFEDFVDLDGTRFIAKL